MKRSILIVLLTFGTVAGFGSGFAHLARLRGECAWRREALASPYAPAPTPPTPVVVTAPPAAATPAPAPTTIIVFGGNGAPATPPQVVTVPAPTAPGAPAP